MRKLYSFAKFLSTCLIVLICFSLIIVPAFATNGENNTKSDLPIYEYGESYSITITDDKLESKKETTDKLNNLDDIIIINDETPKSPALNEHDNGKAPSYLWWIVVAASVLLILEIIFSKIKKARHK